MCVMLLLCGEGREKAERKNEKNPQPSFIDVCLISDECIKDIITTVNVSRHL